MVNRIFGHIWTTLGGLAGAALTVALNGRSKQSFLAALIPALIGALAKDK